MATKLNINLDPASVLNRAKVLLRKRSELRDDLVPLPGVTWEIAAEKRGALDLRSLTKGWMRVVATALATSCKRAGRDGSFVAIVRVEESPTKFGISFQCPYPEIVETVGTSGGRERWAQMAPPDITHKYGLFGSPCPVVFVCTQATNTVLITNENHLSSPGQFLDVDACGTTSGFLNFVGTLLLLQDTPQEETAFSGAEQWMKTAMRTRRHEWLRWFFGMAEKQILFDSNRILVDPKNPEVFQYHYTDKE